MHGKRQRSEMKKTIIWDFDGTLLPLTPNDSEQTLLLSRLDQFSFHERILAKIAIYADMKQLGRSFFKKAYIRLLTGTPVKLLDTVSAKLAEKITPEARKAVTALYAEGHPMLVVSCGTADLIERVLACCKIDNCFDSLWGNRFYLKNGRIDGMDLLVEAPQDKIQTVTSLGLQPKNSVAVGDGYTDIPLLEWSGIPILLDPTGESEKRYSNREYHFLSGVDQVPGLLDTLA
jgi:HAD superfamily phosphoserine phosphatase-like hydrolase